VLPQDVLNFAEPPEEAHLAQDEYYYEIQLTNKQLVFYFMAGAAFLVMSFLAGIVVGRGVDATAEATTVSAPPTRVAAATEEKDRIITEESPAKGASAQDLNYSRLETEKPMHQLESKPPAPASVAISSKTAIPNGLVAVTPAPVKPASSSTRTAAPVPVKADTVRKPPSAGAVASVPPPAPVRSAKTVAPPAPVAGGFAIQVGAFKDRASADSIVARLKGKGFSAYVATPDGAAGGLFNVRVGSFSARPQAEKVEARRRDEEKFKPFIVKQ
jgi:cell division septation protein DedD